MTAADTEKNFDRSVMRIGLYFLKLPGRPIWRCKINTVFEES